MKLNDEDGFPHSEIVGSKVAHTSPTLIAACHVLHRLYMPRHPPNALTSRLRIRTTNDSTGCIIRVSPCGGAVVISAFNCERQQLFAKNSRAATASILRTHSQCQILGANPPRITGRAGKLWSSSLEMVEPVGIEPTTSSLQS